MAATGGDDAAHAVLGHVGLQLAQFVTVEQPFVIVAQIAHQVKARAQLLHLSIALGDLDAVLIGPRGKLIDSGGDSLELRVVVTHEIVHFLHAHASQQRREHISGVGQGARHTTKIVARTEGHAEKEKADRRQSSAYRPLELNRLGHFVSIAHKVLSSMA